MRLWTYRFHKPCSYEVKFNDKPTAKVRNHPYLLIDITFFDWLWLLGISWREHVLYFSCQLRNQLNNQLVAYGKKKLNNLTRTKNQRKNNRWQKVKIWRWNQNCKPVNSCLSCVIACENMEIVVNNIIC